MHKTTVYLPDDLKAAVSRVAATTGVSEATVIREAIRKATAGSNALRPRGALFASGDGELSTEVDQALAGFGDR